MKNYLNGTNVENLFTADLICHGTPGTALFESYIKELENSTKGSITEFSFRDKSSGWGLLASYRLQKKNGKTTKKMLRPDCSSYYSLFLSSETYRESCYSCPWANVSRVGDVTLGDYWGIEEEHPEYLLENGGKLSAQAGISVLLVNSDQGDVLIKKHGDGLILENSELHRAVKWNKQLSRASTHSELRNELVCSYDIRGYKGVDKLFRKKQGVRYYVRYAKGKIKDILKK